MCMATNSITGNNFACLECIWTLYPFTSLLMFVIVASTIEKNCMYVVDPNNANHTIPAFNWSNATCEYASHWSFEISAGISIIQALLVPTIYHLYLIEGSKVQRAFACMNEVLSPIYPALKFLLWDIPRDYIVTPLVNLRRESFRRDLENEMS